MIYNGICIKILAKLSLPQLNLLHGGIGIAAHVFGAGNEDSFKEIPL